MRTLATSRYSTVRQVYGAKTEAALRKVYGINKQQQFRPKNHADQIKQEKKLLKNLMDEEVDPSEMLAYTVPVK
jgi:hypothetical protein